MAWFPCNMGGEPEIANILKGISNPTSSIGENGQLYLKYVQYEKHSFMNGAIIVVENKNDSTDIKLYVNGLTKDSSFLPITDTDLLAYLSDITSGYLKGCSTYDTAVSTTQTGILAIGDWGSGIGIHTYIVGWSQYKAGTFYGVIDLTEPPVQATGLPAYQNNPYVDPDTFIDGGICDSFAKVNNQWQGLIGTDIDDIQSVVEPGGEIKTLVYTLEAGGQWETFSNPSPDNETLLYEVKDSGGNIVLSVKKKISDLPVYNSYVAIGTFDTNKTINAARSSDNSTIYLSVNTTFSGYSITVYTFEPGFGNATVKRGSFVSASTQYGIVNVNIGFKPDLVLVEMPLGNNVSTVSYWEKDLSYAQTDAIWCLKPAENVSYQVALGRQTGETGIQQINNNGFSFMSNGANTREIACNYVAIKYEPEPISSKINIFPYLLNDDYYTVFSKASNDEIYNGGRGGTRASSNPVFYFCCKTTGDYYGYGLIGLTSASVQITATTSYGSAEYYTQTTTNGNTVYLARLGAMNGGQATTIFKNGYFEIDIDGSQYVEQNGSTWLFDQTFVDAAYEALTSLS